MRLRSLAILLILAMALTPIPTVWAQQKAVAPGFSPEKPFTEE